MGEIIPPTKPYVPGDDCLTCFDEGQTPRFVTATFSGITDCWPGDPNGAPPGVMVLEQDPFFPCFWSVGAGWNWICAWDPTAVGGSLLGLSFGAISYFTGFDPDPCVTSFVNTNICGYGLWHGQGGTGVISW